MQEDDPLYEELKNESGGNAIDIGGNKRHPLFEKMENAKFFLMKAPNFECLKMAINHGEWAFSAKAATKLKEAFVFNGNVILFLSIPST